MSKKKLNKGTCRLAGCANLQFCRHLCAIHYSALLRKIRKSKGVCFWCPRRTQKGKNFCSLCIEKTRKNSLKNRDSRSNASLLHRYGITLEDKRKAYEKQKGLCSVCGRPLLKDFIKAHVDHNHDTGVFRGLLHKRCNIAVGYVEHPLFQKVLRYLRRTGCSQNLL